MQVRSGASARVSAQGNFLPLADLLSDADQNLAQVSVTGFSAIRMLNVNDVAIAAAPACPCNRTAAGCHDRRTDGSCPVNSLMIRGRSLLGCFSAAKARGKPSAGNRLDIGRWNLGSALHDLRNSLYDNLFLQNLL